VASWNASKICKYKQSIKQIFIAFDLLKRS
jgi:hypothetical protein